MPATILTTILIFQASYTIFHSYPAKRRKTSSGRTPENCSESTSQEKGRVFSFVLTSREQPRCFCGSKADIRTCWLAQDCCVQIPRTILRILGQVPTSGRSFLRRDSHRARRKRDIERRFG